MISRLEELLGPDAVESPTAGSPWANLDGFEPEALVHPETEEEIAALLRKASECGWPLVPSGRGHALGRGPALKGVKIVLALDRMRQVTYEEPEDLVISAQAGLPVEEIRERARKHGLRLALEPPMGEKATAGGLAALGRSGSSRARDGRVRDHVLGVRALLSDGTLFSAGGRVVKNVAGYDLVRPLVGSRGTLAVLTEVTYKLRPIPPSDRTWILENEAPLQEALSLGRSLAELGLEPAALGAWGSPSSTSLGIRLSGEEEDVLARRNRLPCSLPGRKGEWVEKEETGLLPFEILPWEAMEEGREILVRFALPPSALADFLSLFPEESIFFVDLAAGRGEAAVPRDAYPGLRKQAASLRGFCVVEGGPPTSRGLEAALARPEGPERRLALALKKALDPAGILSPGRLV